MSWFMRLLFSACSLERLVDPRPVLRYQWWGPCQLLMVSHVFTIPNPKQISTCSCSTRTQLNKFIWDGVYTKYVVYNGSYSFGICLYAIGLWFHPAHANIEQPHIRYIFRISSIPCLRIYRKNPVKSARALYCDTPAPQALHCHMCSGHYVVQAHWKGLVRLDLWI